MTDDIKELSVTEFREEGYLQELNRRFLHPLGLALEVAINEDGTERLGRIWDYREDPEGIFFHESVDLNDKAKNIYEKATERAEARAEALGYWVQPVVVSEEEEDPDG